MKEYSNAHNKGMNRIGTAMFHDGLVPWEESTPPDIEKGEEYWTGRIRACAYCGSMHPADIANAIRAGAQGEWADRKYGWPHKAYFTNIPNPFAGMLEIRGSANFLCDGWCDMGNGHSHAPAEPAEEKMTGKFYSVHLLDACLEDRDIIEKHLGLHFVFRDDGGVSWSAIE